MKKTLVLKVNPETPNSENVRLAANIIRNGGLVAFPTETVYGLGADALNSRAVLALFWAKNRPLDNPPIVHVSSISDVYKLVREVPAKAERLMEIFWPGPLTLIFKRSEIVPDVTVASLDTIAVRMPKHNVALALIKESGCPIAAPSANLSGRPSPTTAEHVLEDLYGRIDAILDAGPTRIGVESTVLDLTVDPPQILRPGGTPYEALREVLGNVELHPAAIAEKELLINKARSPGMKHKHYAPKAEMIVVEGELSAIVEKIRELTEEYKRNDVKVGVLATNETSAYYQADVVKSLGSRNNTADMARNLFRLLREFDMEKVDVIIAEGVPAQGLGLAVMNRIRKASGYNIIKV
ncbi:MAG: L-threonylcarbamoyladenylate synthase [Nitrososphaerota archaeon]|nr:L-threonylcarbamoyladenylate synthase [Candidatus Bathyarchaeota archaeon]MDW8022171.1 L-threonylcarbamoyladenylate synthase [Nitrososphaerota archaeon]